MIEHAISTIQAIIATYGLWGVFIATLIEEIVAPIPSALVPLAGGFFLLPPDATLAYVAIRTIFVVALPSACGIMIGSSLVYALGYFGGKPLIERFERVLGITWEDIERIEKRVIRGKHDEITLLGLRLVPIIPGVAISGFCGAVRYPYARFLAITGVGAVIRAFVLGLLGWKAGEYYVEYVDVMNEFESQILWGVVVLAAVGVIYYVIRTSKKKRRS